MEEKRIPEAKFIQNVEQFCRSKNIDLLIAELQEAYSKFKLMEAKIVQHIESMSNKIPEYERNLEVMSALQRLEDDCTIDFMITDTFWTKAQIPKGVQTVCLWLGANTLVEYGIAEARDLISANLNNARSNLKEYAQDLEYVKDQITISEVNIARVHNYNVITKKQKSK